MQCKVKNLTSWNLPKSYRCWYFWANFWTFFLCSQPGISLSAFAAVAELLATVTAVGALELLDLLVSTHWMYMDWWMLIAVCSCENCVIQGGQLTRSVSGDCWLEHSVRSQMWRPRGVEGWRFHKRFHGKVSCVGTLPKTNSLADEISFFLVSAYFQGKRLVSGRVCSKTGDP